MKAEELIGRTALVLSDHVGAYNLYGWVLSEFKATLTQVRQQLVDQARKESTTAQDVANKVQETLGFSAVPYNTNTVDYKRAANIQTVEELLTEQLMSQAAEWCPFEFENLIDPTDLRDRITAYKNQLRNDTLAKLMLEKGLESHDKFVVMGIADAIHELNLEYAYKGTATFYGEGDAESFATKSRPYNVQATYDYDYDVNHVIQHVSIPESTPFEVTIPVQLPLVISSSTAAEYENPGAGGDIILEPPGTPAIRNPVIDTPGPGIVTWLVDRDGPFVQVSFAPPEVFLAQPGDLWKWDPASDDTCMRIMAIEQTGGVLGVNAYLFCEPIAGNTNPPAGAAWGSETRYDNRVTISIDGEQQHITIAEFYKTTVHNADIVTEINAAFNSPPDAAVAQYDVNRILLSSRHVAGDMRLSEVGVASGRGAYALGFVNGFTTAASSLGLNGNDTVSVRVNGVSNTFALTPGTYNDPAGGGEISMVILATDLLIGTPNTDVSWDSVNSRLVFTGHYYGYDSYIKQLSAHTFLPIPTGKGKGTIDIEGFRWDNEYVWDGLATLTKGSPNTLTLPGGVTGVQAGDRVDFGEEYFATVSSYADPTINLAADTTDFLDQFFADGAYTIRIYRDAPYIHVDAVSPAGVILETTNDATLGFSVETVRSQSTKILLDLPPSDPAVPDLLPGMVLEFDSLNVRTTLVGEYYQDDDPVGVEFADATDYYDTDQAVTIIHPGYYDIVHFKAAFRNWCRRALSLNMNEKRDILALLEEVLDRYPDVSNADYAAAGGNQVVMGGTRGAVVSLPVGSGGETLYPTYRTVQDRMVDTLKGEYDKYDNAKHLLMSLRLEDLWNLEEKDASRATKAVSATMSDPVDRYNVEELVAEPAENVTTTQISISDYTGEEFNSG